MTFLTLRNRLDGGRRLWHLQAGASLAQALLEGSMIAVKCEDHGKPTLIPAAPTLARPVAVPAQRVVIVGLDMSWGELFPLIFKLVALVLMASFLIVFPIVCVIALARATQQVEPVSTSTSRRGPALLEQAAPLP